MRIVAGVLFALWVLCVFEQCLAGSFMHVFLVAAIDTVLQESRWLKNKLAA